MILVELLQKGRDGDFLETLVEAVLQILMEADIEGLIGAGQREHSADQLNYENGHRDRTLATRLARSSSASRSCAGDRVPHFSSSRAAPAKTRS